jgi:hypothetical protein
MVLSTRDAEILQTFVDKCEMTSVVTGTIELPKSGYTVYGCYYNDPIKLIVCNNLCVCHVNSTISCLVGFILLDV